MKIFKAIKGFIHKSDFFYTTQLLRYKAEPEYRTLFGGILSLLIFVGLIVTFYSKLIDTLNKVVITSVSSNLNAADPTPFNLSTYQQGKFMFGIQIAGLNLSQGNRYFNMRLKSYSWNYQQKILDYKSYKLQPCTKDHWSGYPQLQKDLQRASMSSWLCPPKNTSFNIQGKYTSNFSESLSVSVSLCTDYFDENRPCASNDQIQTFFYLWSQGLYFTIYFANPLLNPTSKDYLTYYLEDNNYLRFGKQMGSSGTLFVEEYSITTDESIIPLRQSRQQNGGIITQMAEKNFYQVDQFWPYHAQFKFVKSGTTHVIERNFQKFDQILSYIGGLFGTIAICLFIVNNYNTSSYEINLGSYLFKIKQKVESNVLKKYNFLGFLIQSFYGFLSSLGIQPDWKATKIYEKCQQQMVKQLDILYLLKRISFLQRTMNFIFENHQLIGLHLQQKLTLQEAKQIRKNFSTKRKLIKYVQAHKQKVKKQSNITFTQESLDVVNGKIYDSFINDPPIQGKIERNKNPTNANFMFDQTINKDKEKQNLDERMLNTDNMEMSSSQSESDNQSEQSNESFCMQMIKLRKQNERGKALSEKIWQRIDPHVKSQFEIIWNKETIEQDNGDYQKDQFSPAPHAHRFKRRSLRPISINDSPTKGSSTMQLRIQQVDRSHDKMIFQR